MGLVASVSIGKVQKSMQAQIEKENIEAMYGKGSMRNLRRSDLLLYWNKSTISHGRTERSLLVAKMDRFHTEE